MEKISKTDREKLEKLFTAGASRVPAEPEYWVFGGVDSSTYCLECCEEEVGRLLKKDPDGIYSVDGGWGMEGDSTPFCETCEKLLENNLTDYGCEAEIEHFLKYDFDPKSDDDCRAMSEVISARGWEILKDRTYARKEDEKEFEFRGKKSEMEYFDNLYTVCKAILKCM